MLALNRPENISQIRHIILSNFLKVLLISNPQLKKGSISLSVNVGSDNDQTKTPGISHLLEKVIWTRPDKSCVQSNFQDFVSKIGGMSNTTLSKDCTTFYCEVDTHNLDDVAVRFANLFIYPRLDEQSIKKCFDEIDSEFNILKNYMDFSKTFVLNNFVRKHEKRGRFWCGNTSIFNWGNIVGRIYKHWRNYYSSDMMSLVISSNHNITQLTALAQNFRPIKNRASSLRKDLYEVDHFCFYDSMHHRSVAKIYSNSGVNLMYINLNNPPIIHAFRQHPYEVLALLINNASKECIVNVLKEKGLITDFKFKFYQMETYTAVEFCFILTEKGAKEYKYLLDVFVKGLSTLRHDPSAYYFLSENRTRNLHTKFIHGKLDSVVSASRAMLKYPVKNALNHENEFEEYDQNMIKNVIFSVADFSKWIITLISNDSKEKYDFIDYSNGVKFKLMYKYLYIDPYKKALREKLALNSTSDLAQIEETDDYSNKRQIDESCLSEEVPGTSKKIKLDSESTGNPIDNEFYMQKERTGKILYVYDKRFDESKIKIILLLKNNNLRYCYSNYEVYFKMAYEKFIKEECQCLEGIVKITAELKQDGIRVEMYGEREETVVVCEKFIRFLKEKSSGDFRSAKAKLISEYQQKIEVQPYYRIVDILADDICEIPPAEERLKEIECMKSKEVFMFNSYETELMVVGDVDKVTVANLYHKIKSSLSIENKKPTWQNNTIYFKSAVPNTNLVSFIFMIQDSESISECSSIEGEILKSALLANPRLKENNLLKNRFIGHLLRDILSDKFSLELKTFERIGQVVVCEIAEILGSEYLIFSVQSEMDISFVNDRFIKFIEDEIEKMQFMSSEMFETYKENLISRIKQQPSSLEDFANEIFREYSLGYFDRNYKLNYEIIIESITIEEIKSCNMLKRYYLLNGIHSDNI